MHLNRIFIGIETFFFLRGAGIIVFGSKEGAENVKRWRAPRKESDQKKQFRHESFTIDRFKHVQ